MSDASNMEEPEQASLGTATYPARLDLEYPEDGL